MEGIMTKQDIVKAMEDLPEDAGLEDAMERLYFMYKVERSLRQIEEGNTISQEEVEARMKKWLR
jgi:hypothetical protein